MKLSLLLASLLAATLLTACETQTIIKKEIVTVDKPVPFIPTPPEVPQCVSQVDKLIADDAKDPGKVGQAYKYDMLCYRQRLNILQLILDQYKAGSQNFDKVNEQIAQMYKAINDAEVKAVEAAKK